MIFDRIDHAHRYRSLSGNFRKAFDFLADLDLSALTDGRFPIDGEAIYATVGPSSLREPEDALFEAHREVRRHPVGPFRRRSHAGDGGLRPDPRRPLP